MSPKIFPPFLDLNSAPDIVEEFKIDKGWRFAIPRRALFGELDALGHLNHTTFLRYFEDARIGYLISHGLPKPDNQALGCVLAHLEANYHQPVFYDERQLVTIRTGKIGNTSLLLEYGSWSATKGLCCSASTLMVLVLVSKGEKKSVPENMKISISDFENRIY